MRKLCYLLLAVMTDLFLRYCQVLSIILEIIFIIIFHLLIQIMLTIIIVEEFCLFNLNFIQYENPGLVLYWGTIHMELKGITLFCSAAFLFYWLTMWDNLIGWLSPIYVKTFVRFPLPYKTFQVNVEVKTTIDLRLTIQSLVLTACRMFTYNL